MALHLILVASAWTQETKATFFLRDRFQEDLTGEFAAQGDVKSEGNRHILGRDGQVVWRTECGAQFGLEWVSEWPAQEIESPTHLELILVPQGTLEFGVSALGAGKPCGVSIRSVYLNGQFFWELILRRYHAGLEQGEMVARELLPQAELPEKLRVTYNYGVLSLELSDDKALVGHFDNYCAEVREIRMRNWGQPVIAANVRGRRTAKAAVPSLLQRLRLGRAAVQDQQVAQLREMRKCAEALELQLSIRKTCLDVLGPRHYYAINSGTLLAQLHRKLGQYEQAASLLEQLKVDAGNEFGPSHSVSATILEEQGLLAFRAGKWEDARRLFQQAHGALRRLDQNAFDEFLADIASNLEGDGDWRAAIALRERVLDEVVELYSASHWKIHEARQLLEATRRRSELSPRELEEIRKASRLMDSCARLRDKGELQESLRDGEQALAICKQLLGLNDHDTGVAATHVGMTYDKLGKYEHALEYYELDRKITLITRGEQHPEYATVLNNLAQVFGTRTDYDRAERLHLEALAIREANQALFPNDYALSLSNLGRHYAFDLGKIERGLPLFEESHRIRLMHNASDSVEVSRSLSNLGHCYQRIGDSKRAISYLRKSLEVRRATDGEDNIGYAVGLLGLGNSLAIDGQPAEGKECMLKALQTVERLAGKDNSYYPQIVNYLAAAEMDLGEPEQAFAHYHEALKIRAAQVGADSRDCGEIRVNLARAYLEQGRFDEAQRQCEEARRILGKVVGTESGSYQAVENLQLRIQMETGRNLTEAYAASRRLLRSKQQMLEQRLSTMSESLQLSQLATLRGQLHQHLVLARLTNQSPLDVYQDVLTWKSVIAFQTLTDKMVRTGEVDRVQEQLRAVRNKLAEYVYRRPKTIGAGYLHGLQQLEAEKERLQRIAAQQTADNRRRWNVSPRSLAEQLPDDAILIDFIEVNHPGAERRYHAFIVRRPVQDSAWLDWLELGSVAEAVENLKMWRQSVQAGTDDAEAAGRLRQQLWSPVEDLLGAPPRYVYLCPDGALAALPWVALPSSNPGRFLVEESTFVTLPFAQYFLLHRQTDDLAASKTRLLLVGNLDYDAVATSNEVPPQLAMRSAWLEETQAWQFEPLPGTEEEIRALAEMAVPRQVVKLEQQAATQHATIAALREAHYAHFASHGFFWMPKRDETAASGDDQVRQTTLQRNPFLTSGLVLSGANQNSNDSTTHNEGGAAQGILSAEAIASLPLAQMQLVTLSACETQLGQVASGEGVYGLQRAFHLAGARHVVASLWKVEDRATSVLMKLFYHYLWEKSLPPAEALRQAQLTLLREPQLVADQEALAAALLRGLNVNKTVKLDTNRPAGPEAVIVSRKAARIRQWAAFSVSGI